MLEQLTGAARVFGRYEVTLLESTQGAQGNVLEVSDGRGNQVEGAGCERWQRLLIAAHGAHLVTPRSLVRMKLTRYCTSGKAGSSFSMRARALGMVRPSRNRILQAVRKAACASAGTPLRSRPTLFTVLVVQGLPSTIINGGTSCGTLEPPPTIDIFPMRMNW